MGSGAGGFHVAHDLRHQNYSSYRVGLLLTWLLWARDLYELFPGPRQHCPYLHLPRRKGFEPSHCALLKDSCQSFPVAQLQSEEWCLLQAALFACFPGWPCFHVPQQDSVPLLLLHFGHVGCAGLRGRRIHPELGGRSLRELSHAAWRPRLAWVELPPWCVQMCREYQIDPDIVPVQLGFGRKL